MPRLYRRRVFLCASLRATWLDFQPLVTHSTSAKRKSPLESFLISQASAQERPFFDAEGKAIAAQLWGKSLIEFRANYVERQSLISLLLEEQNTPQVEAT